MNETKKRFRGLHSSMKNGIHFVYVYGRDGELLAHVQIKVFRIPSDTRIKVLLGELEK